MRDLPIAPLFGSFTSLFKEPAKRKDEHQSYFILERNIYNSFTSTTNKLTVPCMYATTNNRHSLVAETAKSSAVFYNFSLLINNILLLENIIKKVVHTFKKGAICVSKCSLSIRNCKYIVTISC